MTNDVTRPPIVFISYSHDSKEHADNVLSLSNRLRADGIDCILDQYEDSPREGWPKWMDRQIRAADFVLMICTPTYYRRVMGEEKPGTGLGVMWESKLIYQYIFNKGTLNTQFIPVLFEGAKITDIPTPLQSATYYRLSTDTEYEELYRRLTHQPSTLKPELGKLRALPPRERTQDFVKKVPATTNEVEGTQEEVQKSGSTEELLTHEEREKLISLLYELPNINYANVRHSLVSTLPRRFQGNLAFHKPAKTQITEIIDAVTSDASFQSPDGSFPIVVLIQNALNRMKTPQLKEELQLLLNNLKDRLGVAPQIIAAPTSLDCFIQNLENFILQIPAIPFELRRISALFNNYICQPDCDNLCIHLADLYTPILDFNTYMKQFDDSKIVSNRLGLMEALQVFNKHGREVQNSMHNFCMNYGSLLEQYQAGEREKIQKQLDQLWQRFYGSVVEAAETLYGELCKQ